MKIGFNTYRCHAGAVIEVADDVVVGSVDASVGVLGDE